MQFENFLQLNPILQALCGCFVIIFFIQLYYYVYYYSCVWFLGDKIKKGYENHTKNRPPVSVIICAKNEADNLKKYLPKILDQEYPEFEVIVVNDGSTDETSELLKKLQDKYKNLYQTFLPMDAKYTSRKKTCVTFGIKAAQYDHLLLTDADCVPTSKHWIANMVRNYTSETDIVLGYGAHGYKEGFVNSLICYDTMFIAMQYMGFAIRHKPYMGVGRNLSYKKNIFFKNKGFASHLGLASGDDDLFVQEVATPTNTRVEFNPEGSTLSMREMTYKSFVIQKERHISTSSRYDSGTKMRIGSEVLSRGLFYALLIFLTVYFAATKAYTFASIALTLGLLRFIVQLVVINKTAKQMGEKPYYLSIPLFDILLPLITLDVMTFGKQNSRRNNIWR